MLRQAGRALGQDVLSQGVILVGPTHSLAARVSPSHPPTDLTLRQMHGQLLCPRKDHPPLSPEPT